MALFRSKPRPTAAQSGAVPAGLVSLSKAAAVSLRKSGLDPAQRAAVYLVLDHSGSMSGYYGNGAVQRLAEQVLGLSTNLDDDGTVPVVYFGSKASKPVDVSLSDYAGAVQRTHVKVEWGSTDYVSAIDAVRKHYRKSGAKDPALVVFQTDGQPDDRYAVEQALRDASGEPVFWAFVGFGWDVSFLQNLDTLSGRRVDNASFYHAADPASVPDADLYDGITGEFASWIRTATAAGIIA
jgi:uncharacterized protein YegL